MTDLDKRFLTNTDETGKKYYVEPIGNPADWGDINPATENGFKLIETLEAGMSPLSVVYQRDLEYDGARISLSQKAILY